MFELAELLGDLPDGEFQFKEFDEAQPLSGGKISLVDPAAGEIMEGVAARGTTASIIRQPLELFPLTAGGKSLMVFEAKSQQIFSSCILGFYQTFISA